MTQSNGNQKNLLLNVENAEEVDTVIYVAKIYKYRKTYSQFQ